MKNRQAPLRTKCKVTQESQGPRGQMVYYIQCHWVLGMYLSADPTRDHVLQTGYQVGLEFAM